MVASKGKTVARMPALGVRTLVLVVLSITLMYFDHRENHLDTVHDAIDTAMYPLRLIVDAPSRLWSWMSEQTRSRDELKRENDELREENRQTRVRLMRMSALEAENDRLRAMLEARRQVRDDVRVAEIMSVDANPFRHTVVLDVGSTEGVYDSQAVMDANGVVGQIIQVSPLSSEAILISDPGHALPVEVNRSGLRTIAYGTGDFGRLDLPGLTNNADIQEGDLLVTSGLGGAFPPGYPVAVVDTIIRIPQEPFADISATPTAALDRIREIMLVWSRPRAEETPAGEEQPVTEDTDADEEAGADDE